MTLTLQVLPGTYYVGLKRPSMLFITASRGRIDEELVKLGFRNIRWHDRSEAPPVNPRSYPGYRDFWDEWVTAEVDAPRVVTLPSAAADAIGWIVGVASGASPYSSPSAPSPMPAPSPTTPSTSPEPKNQIVVPDVFQSEDVKEMLRVAGPSVFLGEVAIVVFMGLYAKNRAAEKAEKAVERAARRR